MLKILFSTIHILCVLIVFGREDVTYNISDYQHFESYNSGILLQNDQNFIIENNPNGNHNIGSLLTNSFTWNNDVGYLLDLESNYTNSSNSIALNKSNYPQYKIFQRDGSDQYDFNLWGNRTGNCLQIEASFDGNPYVIIDASPAGTTWSGTLSNQSVGQGRLSVRCANNIALEDGVNNIGIGDVYVVAGQSNAEGNGLNAQQYTTVAPTATVFPTVYTQNDNWHIGNDDTDPGGGPGSVWPIVGGYIAENTGVPVNFITTASGGTNLNTQWQPGNPVYNSFVSQVAEANPNEVRAVLWFQGESDVTDGISREDYNALLDQLILDFQSDAPGTPDLVPGIIGSRTGNINQINTTAIRLATQDAWDDNPMILHGPQTYDIHIINDGEGDNIHFGTDEEIQTLAYRWWKALEDHYYGGNEGRGPQITAAKIVTGKTTIKVDFEASSTLQRGSTPSMWFVNDNGTEREVISASVVDDNTVSLTLATPCTSTNITLTYAKGNSGENKDVLMDSSTGNTALGPSQLPADGFSDFVVQIAPNTFQLEIKVFLEGAFDSSTMTMNDKLRTFPTFPTAEPFTNLGFTHHSGGGENILPGVLSVAGNDAIVDWIFVEVRDGENHTNVLQTQSALIQRDGDIVAMDGISSLTFDCPHDDIISIVVALKHRNHFGLRNLNAIELDEFIAIDFTDTSLPLYGVPGLAAKTINGVNTLIAWDANNDGAVNVIDKNLHWRLQNGTMYDYFSSDADFNLDGVVNSVDKNQFWIPNNTRFQQLD